MTAIAQMPFGKRRNAGQTFTRIFLITVVGLVIAAAALNLTTYALVSRPAHQQVAQLVSGWDRTLKPLLYESMQPKIAAFGASWVRDAFDPVLEQSLTGQSFFNFGVSGGTAYEARRFLDSALAVAPPATVFLNLDSFFDPFDAARARFGFNEDLLRTREDGTPNRWAPLYRAYALTFSGASMGFNLRALTTMAAIMNGARPEDELPAYEQLDFRDWGPAMQSLAARLLGDGEPAGEARFPRQRGSGSGTIETLTQTVSELCGRDIAVRVYATPHHMLHYQCTSNVATEMKLLATLRSLAATCPAGIGFHVFAYPNAVTMEGISAPYGPSRYYRPDGHPRPTVGALMSARMLGLPMPPSTLPDDADFGGDLMAMGDDEARAWLETRKARCTGEWTTADREKVLGDIAAAD